MHSFVFPCIENVALHCRICSSRLQCVRVGGDHTYFQSDDLDIFQLSRFKRENPFFFSFSLVSLFPNFPRNMPILATFQQISRFQWFCYNKSYETKKYCIIFIISSDGDPNIPRKFQTLEALWLETLQSCLKIISSKITNSFITSFVLKKSERTKLAFPGSLYSIELISK